MKYDTKDLGSIMIMVVRLLDSVTLHGARKATVCLNVSEVYNALESGVSNEAYE